MFSTTHPPQKNITEKLLTPISTEVRKWGDSVNRAQGLPSGGEKGEDPQGLIYRREVTHPIETQSLCDALCEKREVEGIVWNFPSASLDYSILACFWLKCAGSQISRVLGNIIQERAGNGSRKCKQVTTTSTSIPWLYFYIHLYTAELLVVTISLPHCNVYLLRGWIYLILFSPLSSS